MDKQPIRCWVVVGVLACVISSFACSEAGGGPGGTVTNDGGMSIDLRPPFVPAKNFAYIPNLDSNYVSVIDTRTDSIDPARIVGISAVRGIAVSSKRAYMANSSGVYVVDTSITPKKVVSYIPGRSICGGGVTDGGWGIAVTPDEKKAYASCQTFGSSDCNQIGVIDTLTNSVVKIIIDGPPGACTYAIDVSPDNQRVYVSRYPGDSITVINAITDSVVTTIPGVFNGFVSHDGAIAVTPDSKKVYVTNPEDNSVTVIDAETNKIIRAIPVGKHPRGIAITPNLQTRPDIGAGYRVYIANDHYDNSYTISVIDTAVDMVVASIPISGVQPSGVSVTSDGRKIYVINGLNSTVSVIDSYSNQVIANLAVGSSAWAIGRFISPNLP